MGFQVYLLDFCYKHVNQMLASSYIYENKKK